MALSYDDHGRDERDGSGSNDNRYPPDCNSSRYTSSDPGRPRSSSSYDRRSETPCRFDRRATIPCRFEMNCTRPNCPYKHGPVLDSYDRFFPRNTVAEDFDKGSIEQHKLTLPSTVGSNLFKTEKDNCDNVLKPKTRQKETVPQKKTDNFTSKSASKFVLKTNDANKHRCVPQSSSTLANLLSSQRRSAAQLHRYRVQQARPFENLQNDVPMMSTAPKDYTTIEHQNRPHDSMSRKGYVTNLNQSILTNGLHKNDKRISNMEKDDATKVSKEPCTGKKITKEEKSPKNDAKKRKADNIESTKVDANTDSVKATKKKKCLNPFRVKVGSIVAVKFRNLSEGGNSKVVQVATKEELSKKGTPKLFEVWAEPISGRDDGVALLGSRIKCVFLKSFVEKWSKKNTNMNAGSIHNSVEGNVVSILGNDDDEQDSGISVGLLVDRERLEFLPFLQVISDDASIETLSSSKLALKKIEDKIRGEKNVIVKVVLATVMDKRKGSKLNRNVVKHWVIRKRVAAKPLGKKPIKSERKANGFKKQSLFVGDGNDSSQQQERNWRWLAAHASLYPTNETNSIDFSSQLVGEVSSMVVHNDPGEVGTLATVTIQRLWTPEQTKYGRTVHDRLELFDDHNGKVHFQAPVEDLFLIGKSVSRYLDESQLPNNENAEWNFHITHSYNASDGTHKPLFGNVCNCRRCNVSDVKVSMDPIFSLSRDKHDNQYTVDESISSLVKLIMKSGNPVNFSLRNHVGVATMRPSFIPNIGVMKSSMYSEVKTADGDKKNQKQARKKRLKIVHSDNLQVEYKKEDVVKVEPYCSRTVPFGDITSDYWYLRNKNTSSIGLRRDPSTREIARPRAVNSKTKEEVTLFTGRAARANQRHLVKSMGSASTSLDRLAGRDRERHLRFGKSTIEGWGVFAEEPISAGDLIVEYRGELIGHAVADKREREYEDANIPDYMFRIDALTVCDATRLGNVARFINASCNPNCYTQIITANENKRIVIYAKRNIARGEELCYDYKFPIEMDPTKRIRCGCGSIECRGYMNWDKRWD